MWKRGLTGFFEKGSIDNTLIITKGTFIIHKFQFLQSIFSALPIIKSRLGVYSSKKPLFYLVVILTILVFGLFVFGSNSALKSLGDFSLLASAVESSQGLFATGSSVTRESPSMNFVQKNSLVAVAPPMTIDVDVLGSMIGGLEDEETERREILEYVVESGDSLSTIAGKFNISLSTILLANELSSKSTIKPGQKLIILPVTGVIYHVKKGDVLGDIAKTYKGKTSEIITANGLSDGGNIFIGDILVIPNGKIPVSRSSTYATSIPVGSSYFIAPVAKYKITQGLHWYNAIDFAASCGTSIYASAGGIVQRVEHGWNGGAGNYIRILHPNGIVTTYGHLQNSLVVQGQNVSQGERIALMGGKPGTPGAGKSTGCHVHFSVRGAKNPFR